MNKSRVFFSVIAFVLIFAAVLAFAGCKEQNDKDVTSSESSGVVDSSDAISEELDSTLPEDVIYDGQSSSETFGSTPDDASGSSSSPSSSESSSSANSSSEISSTLPDLGGAIVLPEVEF